MPVTRQVPVADHIITVRELTVAEVRDWLKELGAEERRIDLAAEFAFDGVSLDDIIHMSDARKEDLERLAPTDMSPLLVSCKELNPHFFRARAAMAAAQSAMLRGLLSATSSPSPNEATA